MEKLNPANLGLSTLLNHVEEGSNPHNAHITPIYQTSVFSFPDLKTGLAIENGELDGYYYTRCGNPNHRQTARKIALLEGLDLIGENPHDPYSAVDGLVFSSGMAAVTAGILGCVRAGETIVAQQALYGQTFTFLKSLQERFGIHVAWVKDLSPAGWEAALAGHPTARLVFAETPVNPTLAVIDLRHLAGAAHRCGCWLMVDNTFATPYCQRPLSLGADVVVHSTTKYLSGHGVVIGGALVSRHVDFISTRVQENLELFGGSASPYDSWLVNLGLKTFELRMQRHCDNAQAVARFLEAHPKVERVFYPGLESHPNHAVAAAQMQGGFGGMLSFELKGGYPAAARLMDRLQVITLAVSLGNLDSLIQHPASMTHSDVPRIERLEMGIGDGLLRLSVGIENIDDLIADLDHALA